MFLLKGLQSIKIYQKFALLLIWTSLRVFCLDIFLLKYKNILDACCRNSDDFKLAPGNRVQYLTYFKSFLTCSFYVNVKCKFIINKDDIFLVKTEIPEFKLKPEFASSNFLRYFFLLIKVRKSFLLIWSNIYYWETSNSGILHKPKFHLWLKLYIDCIKIYI